MTADELERVEGIVNAEIFAAEPIVTEVMGLEEAKASGAVALFGEKYGDACAWSPRAAPTSPSRASSAAARTPATPPSSASSRSSPRAPWAPTPAASRP
jgi:hypothetical protein